MTERECKHGFLTGWCGECGPRNAFGVFLWALVLTSYGCAALGAFFGSPVGQAATETVIGLVADAVKDKIEGKGYLVDEAHAVPELADYFPADDLAGQVCLIPGIGRARAGVE